MRKFVLIGFCILLILLSSCSKEVEPNVTSKQVLLTVTPSQIPTIKPSKSDIEEINPNDSDSMTAYSNPIDEWYLKMSDQYGNSHTDGWISYLYGEAWKAELHHLIKDIYNTKIANSYYNAVEKEADAINELFIEQEQNAGWGTGSSGRISAASAIVYKNAVYQLDAYYSGFIFDAEKATQEYLNEK